LRIGPTGNSLPECLATGVDQVAPIRR